MIGSILLILYWTYRDLADALLMLLAVPGALAGGVLFQWLLGYDFSVTVLVGYIACFGMATVDRHHHARLPARGGRQARRTGAT